MKYQPTDTDCQTVYLCQAGPNVSCDCGLYNVADPSAEALEAMLVRRTRWFAGAAHGGGHRRLQGAGGGG